MWNALRSFSVFGSGGRVNLCCRWEVNKDRLLFCIVVCQRSAVYMFFLIKWFVRCQLPFIEGTEFRCYFSFVNSIYRFSVSRSISICFSVSLYLYNPLFLCHSILLSLYLCLSLSIIYLSLYLFSLFLCIFIPLSLYSYVSKSFNWE